MVPPRLAALLQAGHHFEHLVHATADLLALLAQHIDLLGQFLELLLAFLGRLVLGLRRGQGLLEITHLRLRGLPLPSQGANELGRLDDLLLEEIGLLQVDHDSLRLHPHLRPSGWVVFHACPVPRSSTPSSRRKAPVIASMFSCTSAATSVLSGCWNTIVTPRLAQDSGTPGPRYRSKGCTSAIGSRLCARIVRSIPSKVVAGPVTIARSRRT